MVKIDRYQSSLINLKKYKHYNNYYKFISDIQHIFKIIANALENFYWMIKKSIDEKINIIKIENVWLNYLWKQFLLTKKSINYLNKKINNNEYENIDKKNELIDLIKNNLIRYKENYKYLVKCRKNGNYNNLILSDFFEQFIDIACDIFDQKQCEYDDEAYQNLEEIKEYFFIKYGIFLYLKKIHEIAKELKIYDMDLNSMDPENDKNYYLYYILQNMTFVIETISIFISSNNNFDDYLSNFDNNEILEITSQLMEYKILEIYHCNNFLLKEIKANNAQLWLFLFTCIFGSFAYYTNGRFMVSSNIIQQKYICFDSEYKSLINKKINMIDRSWYTAKKNKNIIKSFNKSIEDYFYEKNNWNKIDLYQIIKNESSWKCCFDDFNNNDKNDDN